MGNMEIGEYGFDARALKRVSYILTTKNRAQFLKDSLTKIKDLLTGEDELILVDGNSTDETMKVIEENKNLIDIFISEPDDSPAHALNKGILLGRGKYIHQLSDDDITYPEAMEMAINALEAHPEVDLLVCGGDKGKYGYFYVEPGVNYGKSPEDAVRHKAPGVGFIMRRSGFAKGGLHPTGWAADIEFVAAWIAHGCNVKFCRVNLFYHKIYKHSVVRLRAREHGLDKLRIVKEYCSYGFYLKYRAKTLFKNSGALSLFKKIRNKTGFKKIKEQRNYLWDGGFS